MVSVQLTILAAYLLIVLGVGYVAWEKSERTPTDFYVSGRQIGTIVLTFTVMASTLSTFAFFGVGGIAAATGTGVFVFLAMEIFAIGVAYQIVGERLNVIGERLNILTPMDYLTDRYQTPSVGIIYVVASFFLLIPYITVQIVGGGIALDVLLGIDYNVGIVLITIIMAIYVHFSGMRGVAWTDLLQGVIMFVAMIGLFLLALALISPDTLQSGVTNSSPELFSVTGPAGTWAPLYTVSYAIAFIGFIALPHVYQRMLSANSPEVLRSSARLFSLIAVPFYFAAAALGVWATGVIPAPENPDYYIPLFVIELTGPIVGAVIIAAAVAALMSTADSLSLSLGSMLSRDVYGNYINPEAEASREFKVTQLILVVIHLLSLGLAFLQPALIFELTAFAVTALGATMPALYIALFWKGATKEGAVASIVIGPAIVVLFYLGWIPSTLQFGMQSGFIGLLIATIVFFVVSFATESPPEEVLDRHF